MKTLYLVGGPPGADKTTSCRILAQMLQKSVFLDGDTCWDTHPFMVTEETKRMVVVNICFLLNSFIACSAIERIVFCWVMHEQSIIDDILSRLELSNVRVIPISLVCSEEALTERIERDIAAGIRTRSVIGRSKERLSHYGGVNTVKIDVSECDAHTAAEMMMKLGAEQ